MNQNKLDQKLARIIKKYKNKCFFSENDNLQLFFRVNNFTLTDDKVLIIGFAMTKMITIESYMLQHVHMQENEIKELVEITEQEFNDALEVMKMWVDLGTIYND